MSRLGSRGGGGGGAGNSRHVLACVFENDVSSTRVGVYKVGDAAKRFVRTYELSLAPSPFSRLGYPDANAFPRHSLVHIALDDDPKPILRRRMFLHLCHTDQFTLRITSRFGRHALWRFGDTRSFERGRSDVERGA